MKKSVFKKINNQIRNDPVFYERDKSFKTTDINILLNRVRSDKKDKLKKKIILSLSSIFIFSFLFLILFSN
jgi:hypothetical protein